ncbi:hypothetical protein GQ55_3G149800 [Panicum hallii var. hallii]|uniref:Uncharacterized protein n=2 Tax=Panicum hallii TaxID=206008 RepID=A0A2T7E9L4_9POAL|nr:hypothetical protein GQ55_3G149800 [Panicum hallii var. hallii]PVH61921.1 hypothetical protein PAHAL_3G158000 [Panicum hallii]
MQGGKVASASSLHCIIQASSCQVHFLIDFPAENGWHDKHYIFPIVCKILIA